MLLGTGKLKQSFTSSNSNQLCSSRIKRWMWGKKWRKHVEKEIRIYLIDKQSRIN